MYVVFLCGGIASGKSTVGRALAARGARVIDLDALSREVTQPGEPVLELLRQEFGADVVDASGALVRPLLAERAFASDEATKRLEVIMHPAIRERLVARLRHMRDAGFEGLCVVEVPLLDRVVDLTSEANEVLCVACPLDLRRERAIARGMRAQDFDARVAQQPGDDYLVAHASHVLVNDGDEAALLRALDIWLKDLRSRGDFV